MDFPPLTVSELVLVVVAFLVAVWNTSVGPTGGVNFAAMASILPPHAAVPIQAVVEAVPSVYRLWLLRLYIDWTFFKRFLAGGVVGFAIGIGLRFLMEPSDDVLKLIMGILILATTWLPFTDMIAGGRSFASGVGLMTSLMGLFTGGVAGLIAAAADRNNDDHRSVLATLTGGILFHHGVKAALFGFFGFSFVAYAPLIICMLVAGMAGTWIGRRLLYDVSQSLIKPVFKAVLTALALNLIWQGAAP